MSPVPASGPPWLLQQLMSQNLRCATSLLQLLDTELPSEKPNMEFFQTTFQKLSHTIEGSFVDRDIQSIWIKQFEDLRKNNGTTHKTTNWQCAKIDVVLDEDTVARTIKPRNSRDIRRQLCIEQQLLDSPEIHQAIGIFYYPYSVRHKGQRGHKTGEQGGNGPESGLPMSSSWLSSIPPTSTAIERLTRLLTRLPFKERCLTSHRRKLQTQTELISALCTCYRRPYLKQRQAEARITVEDDILKLNTETTRSLEIYLDIRFHFSTHKNLLLEKAQ